MGERSSGTLCAACGPVAPAARPCTTSSTRCLRIDGWIDGITLNHVKIISPCCFPWCFDMVVDADLCSFQMRVNIGYTSNCGGVQIVHVYFAAAYLINYSAYFLANANSFATQPKTVPKTAHCMVKEA